MKASNYRITNPLDNQSNYWIVCNGFSTCPYLPSSLKETYLVKAELASALVTVVMLKPIWPSFSPCLNCSSSRSFLIIHRRTRGRTSDPPPKTTDSNYSLKSPTLLSPSTIFKLELLLLVCVLIICFFTDIEEWRLCVFVRRTRFIQQMRSVLLQCSARKKDKSERIGYLPSSVKWSAVNCPMKINKQNCSP